MKRVKWFTATVARIAKIAIITTVTEIARIAKIATIATVTKIATIAMIATIATIALLIASCTREDLVDNDINYDTFTAGFSDARNQTLIEQGLNLHWHEMDQISIFRSTLNEQYQFKGQMGDDSGTFKRMSTESGTQGASLAAIYALYPYSQNVSIGIDGTITMELPAVQEYAENFKALTFHCVVKK